MPANYTVIYAHPSGATATFIYEHGELSALAKGLDAEQFWVFKQVKALLLRNDEGDILRANQMMAEQGFVAQVMRPLPDLLAPLPTPKAAGATALAEEEPVFQFRRTLEDADQFPIFRRSGMNRGEIHWREDGSSGPPAPPPAHRAPAVPMPQAPARSNEPVTPWQGAPRVESRGEIHWREDH